MFLSYNDPAYQRQMVGRDSLSGTPSVVQLGGKYYTVDKGLRDAELQSTDNVPLYASGTGTEDWRYRDPVTGKDYFLSDFMGQGAKLWDSSLGNSQSSNFNLGAGYTGTIGNMYDPTEINNSDTLSYLKKINPEVRSQILRDAGLSPNTSLSNLTNDQYSSLERVMFKPNMANGVSGFYDESGNPMTQFQTSGVDPFYGSHDVGSTQGYFTDPSALQYSTEDGLNNANGAAGFVDRPHQSAFSQGLPFMAGFAGLAGAAGAFGDLGGMFGGNNMGVGTGSDLGFDNLLLDSNVGSGAGLAAEDAYGVGAMDINGGGLDSMFSNLPPGTRQAIQAAAKSMASGGSRPSGIVGDMASALLGSYMSNKQQKSLRNDAETIYNKFVPPWLQEWDQNLGAIYKDQLPNIGTLAQRVVDAGSPETNQNLGDSEFYRNKLRSYYENPSNFEADPGYQFARDEDLKAAAALAAAKGYGGSGRIMAELGDRASKLGYTYLADASNRLNNYGKTSHDMGISDQTAALQGLRGYTGAMGDLSNLFPRYNPSNASQGYVNNLGAAQSTASKNNSAVANAVGSVANRAVGAGLDYLFS